MPQQESVGFGNVDGDGCSTADAVWPVDDSVCDVIVNYGCVQLRKFIELMDKSGFVQIDVNILVVFCKKKLWSSVQKI